MPILLARRVHRAAFAIALTTLVAACKKEPASSPPAAALAPATASAPAAPDPIGLVPLPEDKAKTALNDYRISLAQVQQWGRTQSTINVVMKEHPEVEEQMKRTPPHTLDAMIALLDGQPRIHGAIKKNGMTATDFVLTMIATNQALELYQRKRATKSLPPGLPPALEANVAVVEQNALAINQVFASIAKP